MVRERQTSSYGPEDLDACYCTGWLSKTSASNKGPAEGGTASNLTQIVVNLLVIGSKVWVLRVSFGTHSRSGSSRDGI